MKKYEIGRYTFRDVPARAGAAGGDLQKTP